MDLSSTSFHKCTSAFLTRLAQVKLPMHASLYSTIKETTKVLSLLEVSDNSINTQNQLVLNLLALPLKPTIDFHQQGHKDHISLMNLHYCGITHIVFARHMLVIVIACCYCSLKHRQGPICFYPYGITVELGYVSMKQFMEYMQELSQTYSTRKHLSKFNNNTTIKTNHPSRSPNPHLAKRCYHPNFVAQIINQI